MIYAKLSDVRWKILFTWIGLTAGFFLYQALPFLGSGAWTEACDHSFIVGLGFLLISYRLRDYKVLE